MTLTLSVGTGGGMNNALYSNSEVDELLVRQREAVDPVERQALLREIQELIHADAPWAVLYYEQIMIGTRKNVSGLTVLPNELVIFSKVAKGQ
jgi:ABC-type transport system substrate-binding protein